jgi:hypothetical protein
MKISPGPGPPAEMGMGLQTRISSCLFYRKRNEPRKTEKKSLARATHLGTVETAERSPGPYFSVLSHSDPNLFIFSQVSSFATEAKNTSAINQYQVIQYQKTKASFSFLWFLHLLHVLINIVLMWLPITQPTGIFIALYVYSFSLCER